MPVFDATDAANPPVHMEGWDEDELVYLRPHLTYVMEQRARGKAIKLPPGLSTEQLRAMPPHEYEALLVEHTDNARIDQQLMLDMIERWTLRRYPTRAQREQGERGDVMPLAPESIAQLPPAVGAFLRAEIDKRRDIVPQADLVGPQGDDFRHDVPDGGDGRLRGQGEPRRASDGVGSRDRGKDGLDAGANRRLPGRPAGAHGPVLERQERATG